MEMKIIKQEGLENNFVKFTISRLKNNKIVV